jgi:hypothetical protein
MAPEFHEKLDPTLPGLDLYAPLTRAVTPDITRQMRREFGQLLTDNAAIIRTLMG